MPVFADNAQDYLIKGLSPLPIMPTAKRPAMVGWQAFCQKLPSDTEMKDWLIRFGNYNIGLALGTLVPGVEGQAEDQALHLVAIDIDADDLVDKVKAAMPGGEFVAKVGKKGITIFCLAPPNVHNEKIKRMADGKVEARPAVEILAAGSQTVIPPSVHPDTKRPYEWLGRSLLETPLYRLPIISKESVVDEIVAQCQGFGKWFDNLNTMLWLGPGGGGNTHDTCVAAVASMVARGWTDSDIRSRVSRAKRDACTRASTSYDWPEEQKVIDGWINTARQKGMTGDGKKERPSIEQMAAAFIIMRLGGQDILACVNDELREYRNGYWPLVDLKQVHADLATFDTRIRDRDVRGTVELIKKMSGVNPAFHAVEEHQGLVCLTNGTLNIRSGDLERHTPEHALLHQLPIEWDDRAECPIYERFMKETFGEDERAIETWDEFAAHTLVDDMGFQKVLFLQGVGANGKSTLAAVLRSIHDPSAVATESITDLDHEYHRATLVGKLVSIASEQSRLNNVSDRYLKAITGGDPITVRQPFRAVQSVRLSVRFIQLVNEMPRTTDLSHALKRRIIILECPNVVEDYKQDKFLPDKLQAERPGILARWTHALRRLYRRRRFAPPASSDKAVERYLRENDPIALWMDERTLADEKGTGTRELYADFTQWERLNNMSARATSRVYWEHRLRDLGFDGKEFSVGAMTVEVRRLRIKPGMELPH